MYKFSNSAYIRAHGKAPKGRGHWFFEIQNIDRLNEYWQFDVPGFITLTEAKKKVVEMAKAQGVPSYSLIFVAP